LPVANRPLSKHNGRGAETLPRLPPDGGLTLRRFQSSLLLAAPVVALALSVAAPQQSVAYPPFKDKEGKPCAYCHVKPTGGKPYNYRGIFYKKNNLSFAKFDDKAEAEKAGVPIGPDPEPSVKPKTWTAPDPKPAEPAPAPVTAPEARPAEKLTVATAKTKADAARKAYAAALVDLAHATMEDVAIPPAQKYPDALKNLREALRVDPENKQAAEDIKMIEDVYKKMGKPVPK
jgi:hypothetical protein